MQPMKQKALNICGYFSYRTIIFLTVKKQQKKVKVSCKMDKLDFTIPVLGKATVQSPILLSEGNEDYVSSYVDDDHRIFYDVETTVNALNHSFVQSALLEKAGPRKIIYFEPTKVNAGIVTCGGLCPGINDVIRAIVMCLWYRYVSSRATPSCGVL